MFRMHLEIGSLLTLQLFIFIFKKYITTNLELAYYTNTRRRTVKIAYNKPFSGFQLIQINSLGVVEK